MVRNPADMKYERLRRNLQEAAMGASSQGDKPFSSQIQKTKY